MTQYNQVDSIEYYLTIEAGKELAMVVREGRTQNRLLLGFSPCAQAVGWLKYGRIP